MCHGYRIVLAAVACVLIAAGGVASAAPGSVLAYVRDVVPAEWGGIWSVHLELHKCSNDSLTFSATQLDTICPNVPFPNPGSGGFSITCTTTASGTAFTTHCSGSEQVLPGCTGSFVIDVTASRTGNTFSASGTESITYTGTCLGIPSSCSHVVQTGTRIAPPPTPCGHSAAEGQSWGELKSRYR